MSTVAWPGSPVVVAAEIAEPATLLVSPARHGATDVLRIVAVAGVVFYHVGVNAQLPTLIGMHALIAAALTFAARPGKGSATGLVARRASRLLVPWLFFGLLHLALAAKSGVVQGWMFAIGGSLHLWFVPFIFVATCGAALSCRSGPWRTSWGRTCFWAALALAAVHTEARVTPAVVDRVPVWQFLNGTTAALAAFTVLSVPGGTWLRISVAWLFTLGSIGLWLPWRAPDMMLISPAGPGIILFLAVTLLPGRADRLTQFLGAASFGVYLMHMLVFGAVIKVAARLRHLPVEKMSRADIAVAAALAIVASLIIFAAVNRTPARRLVA